LAAIVLPTRPSPFQIFNCTLLLLNIEKVIKMRNSGKQPSSIYLVMSWVRYLTNWLVNDKIFYISQRSVKWPILIGHNFDQSQCLKKIYKFPIFFLFLLSFISPLFLFSLFSLFSFIIECISRLFIIITFTWSPLKKKKHSPDQNLSTFFNILFLGQDPQIKVTSTPTQRKQKGEFFVTKYDDTITCMKWNNFTYYFCSLGKYFVTQLLISIIN
jgi:hypothetical protein